MNYGVGQYSLNNHCFQLSLLLEMCKLSGILRITGMTDSRQILTLKIYSIFYYH